MVLVSMAANQNEDGTQRKMGAGIALGLAVGVAIGVAMNDLTLWTAIGLGTGIAIGTGWAKQ